jgi:hypothetical protein
MMANKDDVITNITIITTTFTTIVAVTITNTVTIAIRP